MFKNKLPCLPLLVTLHDDDKLASFRVWIKSLVAQLKQSSVKSYTNYLLVWTKEDTFCQIVTSSRDDKFIYNSLRDITACLVQLYI